MQPFPSGGPPKGEREEKAKEGHFPNLAPPSSFLSHLPLRKMGEGQKLLGRFFRGK